MKIKNLRVIADGESNFYTLSYPGNWFCRVQMNGEFRVNRQEEYLAKMAAAVTCDPPPVFDQMTVAYIAYGLRAALAEGLIIDTDEFGGEIGLVTGLIGYAPALDAEQQRRYGEYGLDPDGQPFLFYYEIAEPFGQKYAEMLAADRAADAAPLIQKLFDDADPKFWNRVQRADPAAAGEAQEATAAA